MHAGDLTLVGAGKTKPNFLDGPMLHESGGGGIRVDLFSSHQIQLLHPI